MCILWVFVREDKSVMANLPLLALDQLSIGVKRKHETNHELYQRPLKVFRKVFTGLTDLINKLKKLDPGVFTNLPSDVLMQIIFVAFGSDDPCSTISQKCLIDYRLNELCKRDEWWKFICQVFKFDDFVTRMKEEWWCDQWTAHYGTKDFGQSRGYVLPFHRIWFSFRCIRALTNTTIHGAVKQMLNTGEDGDHPEYGPLSTWDTSRVTDMNRLFKSAYERATRGVNRCREESTPKRGFGTEGWP